jgi:hypothetical protein
MNLIAMAQIATPVLQTVFIVVIGLGYYSVRVTQTIVQRCAKSTTQGREAPDHGLRRWDRKRPGKARDVTSPDTLASLRRLAVSCLSGLAILGDD